MSERYVIPSVERAIRVLGILANENRAMTLAELVRASDIPKSSLFRILVTLQKHRCVVFNEKERSYGLGSHLWELGSSYLAQHDLFHTSSKYMEALASESGETVFLGRLDEGQVMYMRRKESPKSITAVRKLEQRVPAHCTATGIAILAFLPEAEVEAILDEHALTAFNPATITDRDTLKKRLDDVRETGIAVVDGEYNEELMCISAPVFDHTRLPCASLTVAMLSAQQPDDERVREVGRQVFHAARNLSSDLGYLSSTDDGAFSQRTMSAV